VRNVTGASASSVGVRRASRPVWVPSHLGAVGDAAAAAKAVAGLARDVGAGAEAVAGRARDVSAGKSKSNDAVESQDDDDDEEQSEEQ